MPAGQLALAAVSDQARGPRNCSSMCPPLPSKEEENAHTFNKHPPQLLASPLMIHLEGKYVLILLYSQAKYGGSKKK